MSETLSPREYLAENCSCDGNKPSCSECRGTGRRVRSAHSPLSGIGIGDDEPELKRLREENAKLRRLSDWLDQFETETRALPVGLEDGQKGSVIYNWRIAFVREARDAMGATKVAHRDSLLQMERAKALVRDEQLLTAVEALSTAAEEISTLRLAFERVQKLGRVCRDFANCEHPACADSAGAVLIARIALGPPAKEVPHA